MNTSNYIIVDNASQNMKLIKSLVTDDKFISLDKNVGIAAAQNIGIKHAIEKKVDYIWLSDQDTIYQTTYLESINTCIENLTVKKVNYAVVGPAFVEVNRGTIQPFLKFEFFTKKFIPSKGENIVSQLIASGMVIPVDVFEIVGFKNEDLFIDLVDFEWCWRATSKGYYIIGCGNTFIEHTLGDEMIPLFGKQISVRSPFRHYFIIRNTIYLSLRYRDIPLPIKIEMFSKTLIWMFVYPYLAKKDKIKHLRATTKGFVHGLIGRLGPI